jgi:uncharacterized protein YbjT (DUF2867 family)
MKIVVNSGNVGTPVALELAGQGHQVTIATREIVSNAKWEELRIRQARFDIDDQASTTEALLGCEAFFSVTPLVENLVEAGIKAIQAAKAAGITKIVRSSAQGAGPNAAIQLGRMHYAVEKAIEDSGIPFTILRPANFMQNYLTFGTPESIRGESAFYSPLGEAKVSVIDTRDISAVAAKVLVESGHEGKRYELTGGESLSNSGIAAMFSHALGHTVNYVSIPQENADGAMAARGAPAWLVKLISELNGIGKAGYLAEVRPDVELILKRKPITFTKFLADNLHVFQQKN